MDASVEVIYGHTKEEVIGLHGRGLEEEQDGKNRGLGANDEGPKLSLTYFRILISLIFLLEYASSFTTINMMDFASVNDPGGTLQKLLKTTYLLEKLQCEFMFTINADDPLIVIMLLK